MWNRYYAKGEVGRKLKTLARAQQVLCITHLPQIAAFADQHFLIEKKERSGRTHTSIRQLDEVERKQEVARMLSGAKLTETSRQLDEVERKQEVARMLSGAKLTETSLQHAEQLLSSSR